MIITILHVIFAYLASDLLSGIAHWYEDTYINDTNHWLFGGIAADNRKHHERPHDMTIYTYYETISTTIPVVVVLLLLLVAFLGIDNAFAWALCGFLLHSNQFHKWAHMRHPPTIVKWLQRCGIIISRHHHAKHHRKHDSHYCAVSGIFNKPLDKRGAWRQLESVLSNLITNVKCGLRSDRSLLCQIRRCPTVPGSRGRNRCILL